MDGARSSSSVALAERSYAPLTVAHLARLSRLAHADHERYTRPAGRSEYADRLIAVVLAQGAAQHFLDGRTGVKDLDVWRFYAAIPGRPFREGRYETQSDFGPSSLGRQLYRLNEARSARERDRWRTWQDTFAGRRVDHLIRVLPVPPSAPTGVVVTALRAWLAHGSRARPDRHGKVPSAWHLAQKAMVLIDPPTERGCRVWPADGAGTEPAPGLRR